MLTKLTVAQAKKVLGKFGNEAALRILTQEGFLRWAKGKAIRKQDIRQTPRLD